MGGSVEMCIVIQSILTFISVLADTLAWSNVTDDAPPDPKFNVVIIT